MFIPTTCSFLLFCKPTMFPFMRYRTSLISVWIISNKSSSVLPLSFLTIVQKNNIMFTIEAICHDVMKCNQTILQETILQEQDIKNPNKIKLYLQGKSKLLQNERSSNSSTMHTTQTKRWGLWVLVLAFRVTADFQERYTKASVKWS